MLANTYTHTFEEQNFALDEIGTVEQPWSPPLIIKLPIRGKEWLTFQSIKLIGSVRK